MTSRSESRSVLWQKAQQWILVACLLFVCVPLTARPQDAQLRKDGQSQLEISVVAPPQWKKGCLHLGIDRTNRSSTVLYIPLRGLYIDTSVTELPSDSNGKKDKVEFVNIYGASDIATFEAEPLSPGETIYTENCLAPKIPVVNMKRETWRKIPLRGRLRIEAYYFLTKEDWLTNKNQHEEMFKLSGDQLERINVLQPQFSSIFAPVPCPAHTAPQHCGKPPVILDGETRVIPDVYRYCEDCVARGHAIERELAQKSH